MKIIYKNYTIEANREKSMAGYTLLYYNVFAPDGEEIICNFEDSNETIKEKINQLKDCVDEHITEMNRGIKNLIELVKQNPDLPIVPMIDSEIVAEDGNMKWLGSWGDAHIDYYLHKDERIYFKNADFDDLVEDLMCDETFENYSDEEAEKKAEEMVKNYEWVKCIRIDIDMP